MSFKGKVLVLRRLRSGDLDLIARVYGPEGVQSFLIREGYRPSNPFFGLFEPFNLLEVDAHQRGNVLVPNDVALVKRFSVFSSDYERYLWMDWISSFLLRRIRFYDSRVFSLTLDFIKLRPGENVQNYRVFFRLRVLEALGIKPRFLGERIKGRRLRVSLSDGSVSQSGEVEVEASVLRAVKSIWRAGPERVLPRGSVLGKAEELLDVYLDHHMR